MIESIIFFQLCVIGVCIFIQKTRDRKIIASLFALAALSHDLAFHTTFDSLYFYYISAGILDCLVIFGISSLARYPRLASDIQKISLVSIIFNFIGFGLHYAEQPVIVYSLMHMALYGWAIFILIRGEPYAGNHRTRSRFSAIYPLVHSRIALHYSKKKKECHQ